MKHQVSAVLLLVSFSAYADFDMQIIADKSERVGRFSYEDSFDENLVEMVLKNSSAAVKRNIKRLLYPDVSQQNMQRLLLLGGTSNATTTAIAKAIATRCGYEYYVVEASALLQEYREGRQMLLSEIRPIIKQGKPIAIIITELPEMADYSGLLASTLWLLIDQCAQYPDVFVIGTSAFSKGQLSEEIKEHFGSDIISVSLDKSIQDTIENQLIKKMSWLERNKVACLVVGGIVGLALGAVHLYAQILFADAQVEREKEKILLENKMVAVCEAILLLQEKGCGVQDRALSLQEETFDKQKQMLLLVEEGRNVQNQALLLQKEEREIQDKQHAKQIEQHDMQGKQYDEQIKQYKMQREQYRTQLNQFITQMLQFGNGLKLYRLREDSYTAYCAKLPMEKKQELNQIDRDNKQAEENIRKKYKDFDLTYGN